MKAARGRRAPVERHALFDESLGSVVKRMIVDEGKKFLKELPGKALGEPSQEFVQAQVAESSITPDGGVAPAATAPMAQPTAAAAAPQPSPSIRTQQPRSRAIAQGPRQFDPADRS